MAESVTKEGRPRRSGSEKRQRSGAMAVRVTHAERAEIEAAARAAGVEVSEYLRAQALAPLHGQGGQRAPEGRAHLLPFRVTAAERERIETIARRGGLSAGAYVRARALKKPVTLSRSTVNVEATNLARILGLLGLYGSNINQLAKEAHTRGRLPTEERLTEIAREVRTLRDEIMRAMGKRPK